MDDRKPIFLECGACGERWKVATIPCDTDLFTRALKRRMCPNCFNTNGREGSDAIRMCPNDGPDAVTAARDGKHVPNDWTSHEAETTPDA